VATEAAAEAVRLSNMAAETAPGIAKK
jgi:hypothetical protein